MPRERTATGALNFSTSEVLEREHELGQLRRSLDGARQGCGGIRIIEGPGGIGKTRLLSEARSIAHNAGLRVLHARAGELEHEYVFGVVLSLLEPSISAAAPHEREQILGGRASLAAPLLNSSDELHSPLSMSDERSLLHGLYWCVVNLADQRPTVLMIDDAHWADELSLRFLVYLGRRLGSLPLTLVAAIRTGETVDAPDVVARLVTESSELTLRPAELTLTGTRQLLMRNLPVDLGSVGDDFVHASWEVTRGNPFLLSEIVAEIQAEPSAWHEADPAQVRTFTPNSLSRNIALRLTRLGADALKLAQDCAVLGDGAPLAHVCELSETTGAAAAETAEKLISANILSSIDPVTFAHPMVRSAVYTGLGIGERMSRHSAAALVLHHARASPEQIAHHLLSGAPVADLWAIEALHEAGRAAGRKGASETAVCYLRRALEMPSQKCRTELLIDLGLAEAAAGELTALARLEEALGAIDDPAQGMRALYALGRTLYRYGRHDEAATSFRRGIEQAQSGGDAESALQFEGAFMCAAQYVVHLRQELQTQLAAHPDLSEQIPTTVTDRVLMTNFALDTAMSVGSMPAPDTAKIAQRVLGDGAMLREEGPESMAIGLAILALLWSEHTVEAQYAIDRVLADAQENGAKLAFAEASMTRAMIMYARGHVGEAMADAQASIQGMQGGWQSGVPTPQAILAQCLIERGELAAAEAALREVHPERHCEATRGLDAWFYAARGRLGLVRHDTATALADLTHAGVLLDEYLHPVSPAMIPWRSLTATAMDAEGDRDSALALIEEELQLARRRELPAATGVALRTLGIVEDGAHTLEYLHESLAMLENADSPLELSRTLLALGAAHRRAGARVRARELLSRGLDLAHHCGASALVNQTREELLASDGRPRRNAQTGLQALTPSERRIADLAATGQSARAIAESLFISKHTVEWHLRHVYRKLSIHGRNELHGQLQQENPDHDDPVSSAAVPHP